MILEYLPSRRDSDPTGSSRSVRILAMRPSIWKTCLARYSTLASNPKNSSSLASSITAEPSNSALSSAIRAVFAWSSPSFPLRSAWKATASAAWRSAWAVTARFRSRMVSCIAFLPSGVCAYTPTA
ncbi:hypothetical protein ACFFX0_23400 [Citricoccus parietis]|uniref:Uncharacterized protein n=1 Tax=Citricoccus parietis TaxID=592307 RepID=A0ABV5G4W8_9MICC